MEDVKLNTTDQKITRIIKFSKVWSICYILVALIAILWHNFRLISEPSLANWRGAGIVWFAWLLFGFIVLIIWQIRYRIYTSKIYKILIESKNKELPAKNISGWLWLVPFKNFYKPYQILNDIYKYANAKVWKNDKILSCTRRISILTPILWSFIYSLIFITIDNDFAAVFFNIFIPIIFYIPISLILTLPITIRLRNLYELYQENQKEN